MDNVTNIDSAYAKTLLPRRLQNSNKGTFGKILNIAGSLNYPGAAYLSSISGIKSGAGYVTLASIASVINSVSALSPDITFIHLRDYYNQCIASDAFHSLDEIIETYNVITIGCGISQMPAIQAFIDEAIKSFKHIDTPIIFDADALNAIAVLEVEKLPTNTIITPHPKELSRLLNVSVQEIQQNRTFFAKQASEKYNCTTVLKGHNTVVCTKDLDIYINTSGNSALSKAGSGDVLTGIIAGMLAQGLTIEDAAKFGVYLHGLTGEKAAAKLTEYSVLASNLINFIPEAIKSLQVCY